MTQENALKVTDLVFKLGVPILLFLLGLIGNSIRSQLDTLSTDIRSLQREVTTQIETIKVDAAVLRTRVEVLERGG
jgi:hypothetical protein